MKRPPARDSLLIGIVSDVHLGPPSRFKGGAGKLNAGALELLSAFVNEMNGHLKPDLVVNAGDSIEDGDGEEDARNLRRSLAAFTALVAPVHHCIGNHDQVNLSDAELKRVLGRENLYYSFDVGGYHLIILYSKAPSVGAICGCISDEQLRWLEKDLRGTDKPAVIFSHHALADHVDLHTSFWFADYAPDEVLVPNRAEVRGVLEASGKVAAALNGHLHWNRLHVHNGIPYFSVQSLVENVNQRGVPAGAFGVLTLETGRVSLQVYGRDPGVFRHPA